ncbi:hypothetical protein F5884DRAFT_489417 [Xylogone sp. PMI_703]|nr:hypothetical protein F5884DRAFT_489417 [Xylogone sp. PMI_703]
MDYSFFAPAPQPYQFLGLPTPSHHSGTSEDYSNSPPDGFDQYNQFDTYSFPNQSLPRQPTPLSEQKLPINHLAHTLPLDTQPNALGDQQEDGPRRSNSDDDDSNLTPAQSRRKAQNRAAQRAFRERKERHVKDLEAKLAALQKDSAAYAEENERLKRDLQKAATENEILRATSSSTRASPIDPMPHSTGPMRYSPTDFYTEVLDGHDNKFPSHRIVTSEATGERLFAAGAAWDYMIKHPLYEKGLVDVGFVSERLRHKVKCDGQGPVFEEKDILEAIQASVASGSDELL